METNIYDTINTLIPGLLTILGFIVGYLLTRWNDRKPKKPEN